MFLLFLSIVSASEAFTAFPSTLLYNFCARRLALSEVEGFTEITFPWVGVVKHPNKAFDLFSLRSYHSSHNRANSLNLAMYASISEFCTVRFHNSCSSFCSSSRGQYSSNIIILRSSHDMAFATRRVRVLIWPLHRDRSLSAKVQATNFTLLS